MKKMNPPNEKLRHLVGKAVKHYWKTRDKQAVKQGEGTGNKDQGLRSAVTGGAQLDGFIDLVRNLLEESGIKRAEVFSGRRDTILPGFYRPTKAWDLVAVSRGQLISVLEVKSQAGPSFGNNFNNRVEEAIGNATDFWRAYTEGAFKPSQKPFIGYIFLLEEERKSISNVSVDEPHFKVFPEFRDASYAIRYQIFYLKLLRERLYDGCAFLMATKKDGRKGLYKEPDPELGVQNFALGLTSRALAFARQA